MPSERSQGNGKIERLIRTINERLRANKQIILTKDKSGRSEIKYALRISKKKDGMSPFENYMGKEPNTVKYKLVGKIMDLSEQESNLKFQLSDFQDETDSPIFVRERSKDSRLEPTFAKKTGKFVNETAQTVYILPERSTTVKTFSKRDIACASASQKAKFKNASKRRAIVSESTSASEGEEPVRKQKKKGMVRTPELAFDLESEQRPSIIGISSGTTEGESQQIGTSNDKQGIEQSRKQ